MPRCPIWTIPFIAVFSLSTIVQTTLAQAPKEHESQGMPPRATPADYPSQFHVGSVTIAAEFMSHSVPKPEGPLSTDEYVVVEAGIFGPADAHATLSRNDFSLRINGKKKPFPSDPYQMVDHSLKDPEWAPPTPPESKSKTSIGDGSQGKDSTPVIVHVPIELQRAMAQYVEKTAMPEGDRPLPKAGLLFFPYRGSAKSIHSLQLIYSGPLGQAAVDLQP
jgi:hypothetical protein